MVLDLETGYCSFINAVRAGVRVAVDQWPGFSAHAGTEAHLGSATDLTTLLKQLQRKLSRTGRLCFIQPNHRYYKQDDVTQTRRVFRGTAGTVIHQETLRGRRART